MKPLSKDQCNQMATFRKYFYGYVYINGERVFVKYNTFVYFVIQVFVPIKYEPVYRMGKWEDDCKVIRTATYGKKLLIEIIALPSILEHGNIHDGWIASMDYKVADVVNRLIHFNKQ